MANLGRNVDATVKNDQLIITIDLTKRLGPSASGKTTLIATTGGGIEVPETGGVKLNISAYVR